MRGDAMWERGYKLKSELQGRCFMEKVAASSEGEECGSLGKGHPRGREATARAKARSGCSEDLWERVCWSRMSGGESSRSQGRGRQRPEVELVDHGRDTSLTKRGVILGLEQRRG